MIPELINTLPVIAIDVGAFKNCPATSVSIGNNVISIGDSAFTSGSLTSLSLGSNVASIGDSAFQNCNGLTSVIFPASVTSIADNAFYPCTSLKYVIFMGNAPLFLPNLDLNPIYFPTTTAFKGYYFSPNTGFPNGVNAGVYSPVTPWLISKGIPYNANVLSAPRGDGVTLLMAYALNLDPTRNQSSLLPAPVFTGGQMKLTFYAGSAGITYSVEASPDLKSWSTSGVTITGPDINGLVTGSITISGSNRFMRLKVVKP